MNQLRTYVEQHATLFDGYGVYQEVVDNMKEMDIVSYKDIPELKDKIERLLNSPMINIAPKQCYQNAAEVCLAIDGVEYVEGLYGFHGLPISHAWNSYKGQYFDLTMETQGKLEREHTYLGFMNIDTSALRKYMLQLRMWGCFTRIHYTGEKNAFPLMGI